VKRGPLLQKADFYVNYTSDEKGKTLSIGDTLTGVQFSIPFDMIEKEITANGKKQI
jgi:hypothetical protein